VSGWKNRIWLKPIVRLLAYVVGIFIITTVLTTILYSFINPPITQLMVLKRLEPKSNSIKKKWVNIKHISPNMVLAACAAEDNKFMIHNGFDWESIHKAVKHNKKGKRIRGASTISQQTAKNVFLWPNRSWIRKGFETYFTALIELFWSKKRIMEVYLNVAEFGNGIYGVEAASNAYFKKPASELNRYEAAMLATVLPNPTKRNPSRPSNYMRLYQRKILWNMNNLGPIDLEDKPNTNTKTKKH